jgi:hypothetical protein
MNKNIVEQSCVCKTRIEKSVRHDGHIVFQTYPDLGKKTSDLSKAKVRCGNSVTLILNYILVSDFVVFSFFIKKNF